jgi:hypothetical protein
VRFTAADEDRSAAIAVTGSAAALLPSELLAGAGDVRTLTSRARRSATVDELPGDDAVEDVGPRLDTEDVVLELDVPGLAGVEGLYLDLLDLFLALVGRVIALGLGLFRRSFR